MEKEDRKRLSPADASGPWHSPQDGEKTHCGDRLAARNRSILWVLFETGMRTSELCGLRLADVDENQRSLRVGGKGSKRWLKLSPNGWFQVCSYLELCHPRRGGSEPEPDNGVPLFLSETYQPLTCNALTLVFA